jgi:AcrR family transcriptional regulator
VKSWVGKETEKDRQHDATHLRLYDAALSAFRRDGIDGADVRKIAAAAGVCRPTFYFHFPTKDHVLLEWLRVSETRLAAEAMVMGAEGLRTVLGRAAVIFADAWQCAPELLPSIALVAARSASSTKTENSRTRCGAELPSLHESLACSVLAEHFRSAAARGEVVAVLPPHALSALFLGNLFAAALATRVDPSRGSLRGVLTAAVDCFLYGVRPGRADPAPPPSA